MTVELINTGTELLLGRVLNTHQQWLCRELADLGYVVSRQVAVPDEGPAIQEAVKEALCRAGLVFTTGGLGPTSDDMTRDLIAALLGRKLAENATVLARIEQFFAARQRLMPPSTRVQALVPEGTIVLQNNHGTAPGLAIEIPRGQVCGAQHGSWLIMLPGPPRELRPMFHEAVAPLLKTRIRGAGPFFCTTLKTTGLGESVVEEKIRQPLTTSVAEGLEIGYCARVGEVDVRLVCRRENGDAVVEFAAKIVEKILGRQVYSTDDEGLETVVVRLLAERRQSLSLAESCTGGFIANRITNVPGASAVFLEGLVTYSNAAKERLLGVRPETLTGAGAVSELCAREMAKGSRQRSAADFALSVTGIAGPSGGTPTKPVGTVFIGLATASRTIVLPQVNRYDRETFKFVTSQQALELLRRELVS